MLSSELLALAGERTSIFLRCKYVNSIMLGLKGGGLKGLLDKKRKAAEEEFGNSATAKRAQIESVRQQHLRQEEQAELERQVPTQPSPESRPGCQVLWQVPDEQRFVFPRLREGKLLRKRPSQTDETACR